MWVCEDCFSDEELKHEVRNLATTNGHCDVLNKDAKVVDLSELADFFNSILRLFQKDNSGESLSCIIQKDWNLFADETCANKILGYYINLFHLGFITTDKFIYNDYIEKKITLWDKTKVEIKTEHRFFTDISELVHYLNIVDLDKPLTKGDILFRSRLTPLGKKKYLPKEMSCPPPDKAIAGRANPVGIPYLYLSDEPKTTYYEVRASYLDNLSVGRFRIQQSLRIADFKCDISLFLAYDGTKPLEEFVIKKKLTDAISADLSRAIRSQDSEVEYVPTQLICEYCKDEWDGICFESSLRKGHLNYVLFDKDMAKCTRVYNHEIMSVTISNLLDDHSL